MNSNQTTPQVQAAVEISASESVASASSSHLLSPEPSLPQPAAIDRKLIEAAFLAEALRTVPVNHWGINE